MKETTDAIVRITTSTICGTDLHIMKGDVPTVTDGRILGHEAVGDSGGHADRGFSISKRGTMFSSPASPPAGNAIIARRGCIPIAGTAGGF